MQDETEQRRIGTETGYSYQRHLRRDELLPLIGLSIGAGLATFYVAALLKARTPLSSPLDGAEFVGSRPRPVGALAEIAAAQAAATPGGKAKARARSALSVKPGVSAERPHVRGGSIARGSRAAGAQVASTSRGPRGSSRA